MENRPSVLIGDHLFVKKLGPEGKPQSQEYKGYVHDVTLESVHVNFSSK